MRAKRTIFSPPDHFNKKPHKLNIKSTAISPSPVLNTGAAVIKTTRKKNEKPHRSISNKITTVPKIAQRAQKQRQSNNKVTENTVDDGCRSQFRKHTVYEKQAPLNLSLRRGLEVALILPVYEEFLSQFAFDSSSNSCSDKDSMEYDENTTPSSKSPVINSSMMEVGLMT